MGTRDEAKGCLSKQGFFVEYVRAGMTGRKSGGWEIGDEARLLTGFLCVRGYGFVATWSASAGFLVTGLSIFSEMTMRF